MSLCDRCYVPGHCCKSLWTHLRGAKYGDDLPTLPEAQAYLVRAASHPVNVMPWVVKEVIRNGDGVHIRCDCPALLANGRCGVYATRPEACRVYAPRDDALCVHYGEGLEAGADPR